MDCPTSTISSKAEYVSFYTPYKAALLSDENNVDLQLKTYNARRLE